jgi:hypothetical protein
VFSSVVPTAGHWQWVLVNGTQPAGGRVVAVADGAPEACCYKNPYPRPNPVSNPVPSPPAQSARQQEIYANRSLLAAHASNAALPALTQLIDFCATEFSCVKWVTEWVSEQVSEFVDEGGCLADWWLSRGCCRLLPHHLRVCARA